MNTSPNVAELDALLAWAEGEHEKQAAGLPSEWEQSFWAVNYDTLGKPAPSPDCGTACCLAGKTVARAGGVFLIRPEVGSTWEAEMPGGKSVAIEDEARTLLGLNDEQAEALFFEDNEIEDVRRIIAAIKAGDEDPHSLNNF